MAEKQICRYDDKCTKGNKCTFRHTNEGRNVLSNRKPKKICGNGENCPYRPNCRFDHPSSTTESVPVTVLNTSLVIHLNIFVVNYVYFLATIGGKYCHSFRRFFCSKYHN